MRAFTAAVNVAFGVFVANLILTHFDKTNTMYKYVSTSTLTVEQCIILIVIHFVTY